METIPFGIGIQCIQRGIAEIVEQVTVHGVGAVLVIAFTWPPAACEFNRVVRCFRLELLDGVGRVDVRSARSASARFREQHLVVVGAVNVVLVVEAADAVEADEAEEPSWSRSE